MPCASVSSPARPAPRAAAAVRRPAARPPPRDPRDAARARRRRGDLAGRHVVVSAGGTREPLDPVRFLGNRSSGKQGHALAVAAAARGAQVTLVTSAPADLPGIDVVTVETALQLREAVHRRGRRGRRRRHGRGRRRLPAGDLRAPRKIKKTHDARADGSADDSAPVITLVRNPDILAELVERRGAADQPRHRRLRGRDRRRATGPCSTTAAPSSSARAVTSSSSTRSARTRPSAPTTTPSRSCGAAATRRVEVGPASKAAVSDAVWDVVAALL